jgi:tellurite resistance protein TerC
LQPLSLLFFTGTHTKQSRPAYLDFSPQLPAGVICPVLCLLQKDELNIGCRLVAVLSEVQIAVAFLSPAWWPKGCLSRIFLTKENLMISELFSMLPSLHEFTQALPVIAVICFIDGLLSFDNALVLATMVQHLPENLQKKALRYGLGGAFLMRGGSLFCVGFLISHPWIKIVGAGYLVYLMCSNLGGSGDEDEADKSKVRSFWSTIIAVEFADMAFSTDNIIATVAMSPKIWVVCIGVFASIVIMRFVAGIFIGLVEKFPILAKVSYVLVGFIGFQLAAEYFLHFEMSDMQKFGSVVGIVVAGMLYERATFLHPVFDPIFRALSYIMGKVAAFLDWATSPIVALCQWAVSGIKGAGVATVRSFKKKS